MNRLFIFGALLLSALTLGSSSPAYAETLSERLSGRILLQVERNGEGWYVEPSADSRAFLGRPADAFRIMRELGLGITNGDLDRIATSGEKTVSNPSFTERLAGKILLQVQANGEAWYVDPIELKRTYLGRPADAFSIMRSKGLGISNADLEKIPTIPKYADPEQTIVTPEAAAQAEGLPPTQPQPAPTPTPAKDYAAYAGSYRCWSYNVSGGGSGDCRLFAPIVLNADGTYAISSEKGTYSVSGSTIILSESKLRGPGTLIGGTQIRFEYDYNGWHHVITYLKESGSTSPTNGSLSEIPVQLILQYPTKQSSLGSITTVELVPEGQNVATASYKPTAIAVWDGNTRVTASFYKATNMPKAGKKYTVYTSYGGDAISVGTLDLTNVTKETTVTINVGTGETKQETTQTPTGVEIVVEIDLVYPSYDSSLGSIQTVTLVPQGQDPVTAAYKPMALAVWDSNKTVVGSFHKATNQVKTGAIYDVYADWGAFGGYVKSGTLDLTTTTAGPVTKTIQTTISGNAPTSTTTTEPTGSATTSTTQTTYVAVTLILQYAVGDSSLDNVTRIGFVKQGETYYQGYGYLAGYGSGSQQLTASVSNAQAGFVYDVYTDGYTIGTKKVGVVDLRGVTADTTKTITVQ
ncbi:MAG: hypothetical protein AAB855_03665 [Patescibacteria group bacterium]